MNMFSTAKLRADFSQAADRYDLHSALQRHVLRQAVDALAPLLPAGPHVLDAGCGTGYLAEAAPGWKIAGVDAAQGMCRAARGRGMAVVQADIARLPYREACFDACFSSLVLQWAGDPLPIVQELQRVTTRGGYIAITVFGQRTLSELRAAFAAAEGKERRRVSDFLPARRWREIADAASLRLVEWSEETRRESYADLAALMHSLKAIGAAGKDEGRPRGLATRGLFARVEREYPKDSADGNGISATWQIYRLILQKP